jgi:Predicted membrane protein (DUF2142)
VNGRARIPLLVTAFLVLMGAAWLMATPPGASFDEGAHYIKAAGVGRGELYGRAPTVTTANLAELYRRGAEDAGSLKQLNEVLSTDAVRWQARTRRRFEVPPNLVDNRFGCTKWDRTGPATCLNAPRLPTTTRSQNTYVGTYQPFIYVPAGLAIRAASAPGTALRLARVATLALSLLLLIAAVWLLWAPGAGALSLAGAVAALTPMVVFISSVLSPSGPEIAGAVCFSAALLRLGRGDSPPAWLWLALGAAGCVLASARALGPAFVVLLLLTVAALVGPRRLVSRIGGGGKRAAAAALAIAVAGAASLFWEFKYQPRPSPNGSNVFDAIEPSFSNLPYLAKQTIGVFGSLDAPMPGFAYALWAVILVGLGVLACIVGDRRDRLSLAGLFAALVVVTMVMSVVYREIGALHGRYALPVLMLLPLWEGEIVLRRRTALRADVREAVVATVFGVAALVQLVGWWSNARRFSVGRDGGWMFLDNARWSPPLGWWPWVALAALAAAAYVIVAAEAVRARRRAASPAPL